MRKRAGRSCGFWIRVVAVLAFGFLISPLRPRFVSASPEARDSELQETLQYLRTQITVFKAQHREVPPGYPDGDVSQTPTSADAWSQLKEYSNDHCAVSSTPSSKYPLGKYLREALKNPMTGSSDLWVVTSGTAIPAPDRTRPFGWIYNPQTQEIIANVEGCDSQGVSYSSY